MNDLALAAVHTCRSIMELIYMLYEIFHMQMIISSTSPPPPMKEIEGGKFTFHSAFEKDELSVTNIAMTSQFM